MNYFFHSLQNIILHNSNFTKINIIPLSYLLLLFELLILFFEPFLFQKTIHFLPFFLFKENIIYSF